MKLKDMLEILNGAPIGNCGETEQNGETAEYFYYFFFIRTKN